MCEGYNQRVVFKDGMHGLYPPRAIGPANPRFAPQYVNLQPAPPGPSHLQRPIAPAPPLFRDDGITPLDQTLPPHLRAHYEERAQNLSAYDGPRLNVHVPLSPPGLREGEYQFQEPLPSPGYPDHQYSPDRYHQHTPASATAAQFAIQSTHIKSEHDSNSLFGPHPSYSPPAPQQQQPQQQQRPQYEGQSGSMQAAYSPPQSSAPPTSANNCPLHIPLDRKYAEVSGTRAASHQPNHDYSDIFNQCSDLRRSPSPRPPRPSVFDVLTSFRCLCSYISFVFGFSLSYVQLGTRRPHIILVRLLRTGFTVLHSVRDRTSIVAFEYLNLATSSPGRSPYSCPPPSIPFLSLVPVAPPP